MELRKQLGWSRTWAAMYHFRTQNGQEVDIFLEDPAGRCVGIEVKSSAPVEAGDFKGLRQLAEQLGPKFVRGIVLYTGTEAVEEHVPVRQKEAFSPAQCRELGPGLWLVGKTGQAWRYKDGIVDTASQGQSLTAPASIKLINSSKGKMRVYTLDVELKNTRNQPVWFLMPYFGDRPLNTIEGRLVASGDQVLEETLYIGERQGGRGRAVIVEYVGMFSSIWVPPGGTVRFQRFGIESNKEMRPLQFWQAASTTINGQTPLENWFPESPLSDNEVVIAQETYSNKKTLLERPNPEPAIRFAEPEIIGSWTVPMLGIDEEKVKNIEPAQR